MGVITDYFSAPSDEAAARVFDRPGGPAQPLGDAPPLDTVESKGIDPAVMLGTLEAIITGRSWQDVFAKPGHGKALAHDDEGCLLVCAVSVELQALLAPATSGQLAAWAVPWSQTEEFRGAEPDSLTWFLDELAALARRASARDERLYCWICV
jgi:hypothetical protein